MTRRWSRTVGGLLAALLACPGIPAAEMDTTSELIRLADVVGFLRRRILAERPDLLADPEGQRAAFRAELARLDLDPPEGVRLDVQVDDLNLAGLLLEEQLRRRRTARRQSLVAEAEVAFEVPDREAPASAEPAEESVVPEVARLFSAIHADRAKVPPLPGPHPAGGRSEDLLASEPEAQDTGGDDLGDLALAAELAEVGAKLRAALARVDGASTPSEDPRFGDRDHRVSGLASAAPSSQEPAPVARVLPAPAPRGPDLDTRRAAVPVAAPAALVVAEVPAVVAARAPAAPAGRPATRPMAKPSALPREAGVTAVLAQVLPLVQAQGVSASEFPAVLSATLATFGVTVPGDFRPRPEDSAEAMARELIATSGGTLDLGLAAAALGI